MDLLLMISFLTEGWVKSSSSVEIGLRRRQLRVGTEEIEIQP